jgi:hypothetical protein
MSGGCAGGGGSPGLAIEKYTPDHRLRRAEPAMMLPG